MFFRSSFSPYQDRAKTYLAELLVRVSHLQWDADTDTAGPIIMTQIENEFGNYGYGDHPRDKVSIFCMSFEFLLLYCRHISVSSNQCSGMRYT